MSEPSKPATRQPKLSAVPKAIDATPVAKDLVAKTLAPAPAAKALPAASVDAPTSAAPVAEPVKRKRGRPPGARAETDSPAPRPAVAEPVAAKPAFAKPVAITPPAVKPTVAAPTPDSITHEPVAPLVATAVEGQTAMNDTISKMQDAAKTFTGDAGARTQALFGDFSGRAKGAYDKSVKMTEEFTEFQKGNVEAMVESSKLAAKAAEALGQEAADYARKSFETTTAAFKTFASAKSPTELFKLQSDYFKSYFDSAVAESSKVTEAWLKLAGEVAQPLSNRVAVAVEKVKATTAI